MYNATKLKLQLGFSMLQQLQAYHTVPLPINSLELMSVLDSSKLSGVTAFRQKFKDILFPPPLVWSGIESTIAGATTGLLYQPWMMMTNVKQLVECLAA
jgi:hypothetical protein